jgi:hypothetical protein
MNSESLHQPVDLDDRLADALMVVESLAEYARAEHLTKADELLAGILVLLVETRFSRRRYNQVMLAPEPVEGDGEV